MKVYAKTNLILIDNVRICPLYIMDLTNTRDGHNVWDINSKFGAGIFTFFSNMNYFQ